KPGAAGAMRVQAQRSTWKAPAKGSRDGLNQAWVRHASRVAKRNLRRPQVEQPRTQIEHPLDWHVALERAAEYHREHRVERSPRALGNRRDIGSLRQRLSNAHIYIALIMAFGCT